MATIGRPPEPVPEDIAERILGELSEGRSLTSVCAEIGISTRVVSKWTAKDDAFRSAFAHARGFGAAIKVDKASDIVDAATPQNWQVAKIQAEHAMKVAACYCPKVFGQKAQIEHSGSIDLGLAERVRKARERLTSAN